MINMDNLVYWVGALNIVILTVLYLAKRDSSFWISVKKAPWAIITLPFRIVKAIPIGFWMFVVGGPLGIILYMQYKSSRTTTP